MIDRRALAGRPRSWFLALALVLVFVGAGCWPFGDERLAALKADEIATLLPTGGTLVREFETEEHTALGKPIAAKLVRVFAFSTKYAADSAWMEVVDEAEAAGWSMSLQRLDPSYPFRGAKELDTGPAMISVGRYRNEDGIDIVSIELLHRQCPETTCRGT